MKKTTYIESFIHFFVNRNKNSILKKDTKDIPSPPPSPTYNTTDDDIGLLFIWIYHFIYYNYIIWYISAIHYNSSEFCRFPYNYIFIYSNFIITVIASDGSRNIVRTPVTTEDDIPPPPPPIYRDQKIDTAPSSTSYAHTTPRSTKTASILSSLESAHDAKSSMFNDSRDDLTKKVPR